MKYNTIETRFEIIQTNIFANWLKKIKDQTSKAKITENIYRMINGNFGNTRSIGNGIFEKKINYANGFRIYYFLQLKNKVLLLCGGNKSSQQKDIKLAKKIKKDYENQNI